MCVCVCVCVACVLRAYVTLLQVLAARIVPTSVPFEGESTTHATYTAKVGAALLRPVSTTSKRAVPCTASDPVFGLLSTYAAAFIAHPLSTRCVPPQVLAARSVPSTLSFEGESTCHRDFCVPSATSLHVGQGKTEAERAAGDFVSTHMATYVAHPVSPRLTPPQVLAARTLPSSTPFEGQSTYQCDFRAPLAPAAVDVIEEKAEHQLMPPTEVEYVSTHMATYVAHPILPRPTPPQVLAARVLPSTVPFDGESTYHREFRAPSSLGADSASNTVASDVPIAPLSSATASETLQGHYVQELPQSMSVEELRMGVLPPAAPVSARLVVPTQQQPESLPSSASESAGNVDTASASAIPSVEIIHADADASPSGSATEAVGLPVPAPTIHSTSTASEVCRNERLRTQNTISISHTI
jgi:hypothetical protein